MASAPSASSSSAPNYSIERSSLILRNTCNNCIFLVRELRTSTLRTMSHVFEEARANRRQKGELSNLLLRKLEEDITKLECTGRLLPSQIVQLEKFERMKYVFEEEQINLSTPAVVETMVDAGYWNEGNWQFYQYAERLLGRRRRPFQVIPKPVAYSNWETRNPHEKLSPLLAQVQREFANRKTGIQVHVLDDNGLSSVTEVKFFTTHTENDIKQFVCTQKTLLIEEFGEFGSAIFVAPQEEWQYTEEFGQRRIDLAQQSQHEVYRRLTVAANEVLPFVVQPFLSSPDVTAVMKFFQFFYNFHRVFLEPCFLCKKYMKDFMPPVYFDIRFQPKAVFFHESCRQ